METERQRLRVVFDTNIFVAAHLSKNPHSPTMELLRRWRQEKFELLYSDDSLVEIDEKFSARGIGDEYKDKIACWSNCVVWLPTWKSSPQT